VKASRGVAPVEEVAEKEEALEGGSANASRGGVQGRWTKT